MRSWAAPSDVQSSVLKRWPTIGRLLEWSERTLPGRYAGRARELNLPMLTLALAAQQMLCTAPLLVAVTAVGRRYGERGPGSLLSRYLGLTQPAAGEVEALFRGSDRVNTADLVIGLAFAIAFTVGVAAVLQRGFETLWRQPRGNVFSALRQVVWVVGLLGYLVVVLYAGREGHRVGRHLHAGGPAGPLVQLPVSFIFYWWSQHLLLSGRVAWRQLLPGAVCMAAGSAGLVSLSGRILSGQISEQVSDYGLIGATFLLSVWVVTLSSFIFGGCLVGVVLNERRDRRRPDPRAAEPVGISA